MKTVLATILLGAALLGGLSVSGCSKSESPSPSTPTPEAPRPTLRSPGPPEGATVRFSRPVVDGRELGVRATFTWQPPSATSSTDAPSAYAIEVGTREAATDVFTSVALATARSFEWTPPLVGQFWGRIRASNEAGSAASADLPIVLPDIRDVTEALFLGTGPYGNGGCPGAVAGEMAGWQRGSRIRVIQGAGLSPAEQNAVSDIAQKFTEATGGAFQVEIRTSAAADPAVADGEIGLSHAANCPSGAHGCAYSTKDGSRLRAGRVYLLTGENVGGVYHELGHALVGLCHINYSITPPISSTISAMLGAGVFTDVDLSVIRNVYSRGLSFGATRSQFAAAGLVR